MVESFISPHVVQVVSDRTGDITVPKRSVLDHCTAFRIFSELTCYSHGGMGQAIFVFVFVLFCFFGQKDFCICDALKIILACVLRDQTLALYAVLFQ